MRPMLASILRVCAFAAFVVLGIAWSSDKSETLGTLWMLSFALVALVAVWDERPDLGAWWERVPGPSKNPDDYR